MQSLPTSSRLKPVLAVVVTTLLLFLLVSFVAPDSRAADTGPAAYSGTP